MNTIQYKVEKNLRVNNTDLVKSSMQYFNVWTEENHENITWDKCFPGLSLKRINSR
jgi:hypothetical protein